MQVLNQLQQISSDELFSNFELLTEVNFITKKDSKSCGFLKKRVAVTRRLEKQLNKIDFIYKKSKLQSRKVIKQKGQSKEAAHNQLNDQNQNPNLPTAQEKPKNKQQLQSSKRTLMRKNPFAQISNRISIQKQIRNAIKEPTLITRRQSSKIQLSNRSVERKAHNQRRATQVSKINIGVFSDQLLCQPSTDQLQGLKGSNFRSVSNSKLSKTSNFIRKNTIHNTKLRPFRISKRSLSQTNYSVDTTKENKKLRRNHSKKRNRRRRHTKSGGTNTFQMYRQKSVSWILHQTRKQTELFGVR